jgi:hypothetical protein
VTTYRLDRTRSAPVAPPELDAFQQSVVDHPGGPLLVLAGPGTGKTTTLVEAIVDRVDRRGAGPESVLALTFSRKAAEQLRDRDTARLGRLAGEGQPEDGVRMDATVLDAVGDRLDQGRGLARAGAGQHEQRAARMVDDGLLGRIESRRDDDRCLTDDEPVDRCRSPLCHPSMESRADDSSGTHGTDEPAAPAQTRTAVRSPSSSIRSDAVVNQPATSSNGQAASSSSDAVAAESPASATASHANVFMPSGRQILR